MVLTLMNCHPGVPWLDFLADMVSVQHVYAWAEMMVGQEGKKLCPYIVNKSEGHRHFEKRGGKC